MSRRHALLHLLVAALVASSFAAPAVTHGVATGDRGHALGPIGIDLLQQNEPAVAPESAADGLVRPGDRSVTPDDRASDGRERLRDGLRAVRADELHRRGVTGEGVRVGVIGSGFDPSNGAIVDNVAAHRAAGRTATAGNRLHDTAVAEVVAGTAPGSELYLVGVGPRPTPDEYADAIAWLLDHDVDVVVDSGSYFPAANGRSDRITAAAERASERGVAFVTSAGNYANRHWAGESDGDGWVEFPGGSQVNPLADGDVTDGRVSIRLTWTAEADYDLYLYRVTDGGKRVVAKSARRQAANATLPTSESIAVTVPEGRYYVGVYAHEDRTGGAGTRLQLFSSQQTLRYATEAGSVVAPATSEEVISVGAYDAESGKIREYSSRGGAHGVDVEAPDGYETGAVGEFRGTSAAAPYVAGTAALMESNGRSLAPARIERILERTARGDDGTRRLDSLAAVEAAAAETVRATDAGGTAAVAASADPEVGANATGGASADDPETAESIANEAVRSGSTSGVNGDSGG